MPALGEEFRSAREARGLTLSNVAEQIYIRSVYLNAIEHEDWAAIGAPVYVRGFIRTYARFLGLDGESAVERFNQSVPQDRPHPASTTAVERERIATATGSGPSIWAIAGTLIAVVLVGFVGFEWWSYARGSSTAGPAAATAAAVSGTQPGAATAGSQSPAAGASGAPSPVASKPPALHHQLAVRLTQRSWLRVVVDGSTKIEGIFPAGTVRTFAGRIADVRAGNAGGVSVSVNGRPPAPMGKVGDVAEQRLPL